MRKTLIALATLIPTALPAQDAATQAKQILPLIKAQWVSVREWEGQDLIYFTMLDTWRCGIESVEYGINTDAPDQVWEQPDCDPNNPNAIPDGHLPYTQTEIKSVETLSLTVKYKDGDSETVQYERAAIQIQ